jgi:hypothetical protein
MSLETNEILACLEAAWMKKDDWGSRGGSLPSGQRAKTEARRAPASEHAEATDAVYVRHDVRRGTVAAEALLVAVVLLVSLLVGTVDAQSAFTPLNKDALITAKKTCLIEKKSGACWNFSATTWNGSDWHGAISTWIVSSVTDMSNVFDEDTAFASDLSEVSLESLFSSNAYSLSRLALVVFFDFCSFSASS